MQNVLHENVFDVLKSVLLTSKKKYEKNKAKTPNYLGGSIARYTKNLTMTFPLLADNSLPINTIQMVSKATERNVTTMLQMLFASLSLKGSNGAEVLSRVHKNIETMSMDDVIDKLDKFAARHESSLQKIYDREAINEMTKQLPELMKEYPANSLNEKSLNDYLVRTSAYDSSIVYEAPQLDPNVAAMKDMKNKYETDIAAYRDEINKDKFLYQLYKDEYERNYRKERDKAQDDYRAKRDFAQDKYQQDRDEYQRNRDIEQDKYRRERDKAEDDYRTKRDKAQDDYRAKRDSDQDKYRKERDKAEDDYRVKRDEYQQNRDIERDSYQKIQDKNRRMRDQQQDFVSNLSRQVVNQDIKKANELQPTLMSINVNDVDENGNILNTMSFAAGVKSRIIDVDAMDIVERVVSKNKTALNLKNLLRSTTGEIKFMKDFILCIPQAKINAKNAVKKGEAAQIWNLLEKRAASNAKNKYTRSNDASAISTLLINQETVNYIKNTFKVDLNNAKEALFVMNTFNLLSLVIADESNEVAKFLYDGNNNFESVSYAGLSRDMADSSTYKKTVNLINQAGR